MNDKLDAPMTTDEETALSTLDVPPTLDDTTIRSLPDPDFSSFWYTPEPVAPAQPRETASRAKTFALMAAVAIASFVAGGLTARAGAQVPLLFAQREQPHESTASLEQRYTPTHTTNEEPSEEQEPSSPVLVAPAPSAPEAQSDEDHSLSWDFDEDGDRSVSYDRDDSRLTLDYDGYSFSFTLDDLVSDKDYGQTVEEATPTSEDTGLELTTDTHAYGYPYQKRYDYDAYGTGSDTTDAERDADGWRGWSTQGSIRT